MGRRQRWAGRVINVLSAESNGGIDSEWFFLLLVLLYYTVLYVGGWVEVDVCRYKA
jgi:hypothetical protein